MPEQGITSTGDYIKGFLGGDKDCALQLLAVNVSDSIRSDITAFVSDFKDTEDELISVLPCDMQSYSETKSAHVPIGVVIQIGDHDPKEMAAIVHWKSLVDGWTREGHNVHLILLVPEDRPELENLYEHSFVRIEPYNTQVLHLVPSGPLWEN